MTAQEKMTVQASSTHILWQHSYLDRLETGRLSERQMDASRPLWEGCHRSDSDGSNCQVPMSLRKIQERGALGLPHSWLKIEQHRALTQDHWLQIPKRTGAICC